MMNSILKSEKFKIVLFKVCFAAALLTAFIYGLELNTINDGFWHIKVGEYIIKNKVIPHRDIFSWYGIQNKFYWISHEWLFGIIAYCVYKIKKFTSVIIFSAFVNLVTSFALYKYSFMKNKNKFISLIIMWIYILGSSWDISYRPILISKLILILVFILLEKRSYLCALLLLIIGINIHGGIYPLYLIIFAYYTLPHEYKYFFLSVLAIFINPYGYKLYEYTYLAMKNADINSYYINEWGVTPIYSNKIALIIIGIVICVYAVSKIRLKDFLLSGAFIILALSAKRQVFVIFLFVLPIISSYLYDFYYNFFEKFISQEIIQKLKGYTVKLNNVTLALVIIMLLLKSFMVINKYFMNVNSRNFTPAISNSSYPLKACDYINSHDEIKTARIFNDYNSSPYIIFRGIKTFVDTREDLFTYNFNKTNAFVDQMKALNSYDYMIYVFKKYNIQYAILRNDMPNTKLLVKSDKAYKIYGDDCYSIFEINEVN